MEVQNISGSDVVIQKFSSETVQKNEQAPEQKTENSSPRDRAVDPGKGGTIDRIA